MEKIDPKKELIKAINKMPLKIQTMLTGIMMDKYHTVDYNAISLNDLNNELIIILQRQIMNLLVQS